MNAFSRALKLILASAALVLPAAGFTGVAEQVPSADQYVLQASRWEAAQTAAVEAAGGTIIFAHAESGIGVVTASDPNFLENVYASGVFQDGERDFEVQWHPAGEHEQGINPSNDTLFPLQWPHLAMETPAAWAAGCTGAGVRVAVIDGGIFATHPDLSGAVDVACSRSFVPGQSFDSDDGTFWHGTLVAGVLAARDNDIGVIGVAPEATIVGVKATHAGLTTFGTIIGAILYAADPVAFGAPGCAQADIINMSLSGAFPRDSSKSLAAAVRKAVNFAYGRGVLVVASAGNEGIDFDQARDLVVLPAQAGQAIAVSATGPVGWALGATNFRRPAVYTNFGEDLVYVAAPGGNFELPGNDLCTMPTATGSFTQPCWVFDMYLSTIRGTDPDGGYRWSAGTSFAAPSVSGVAALIRQANPGISVGALKIRLKQTADDEGPPGKDAFYGHGFVNARRACTE